MSEQTKIQWCDSTINFWSGCTKVSAGCANCYAEARDKRHMIEKVDHWGPGAPRLKHVGAVKQALAFNRKPWICGVCDEGCSDHYCKACSSQGPFHRRRIFSLSLGDWLDPEVPIEWLAEMLDTIRQCDQVEWILCTKRPQKFIERIGMAVAWMPDMVGSAWLFDWASGIKIPSNITLLASVENQEMADLRIPHLLRIPAAQRGLSLEPLLGPVELREPFDGPQAFPLGMGIKWLIIGGESGPNARPCNVDWIHSLVRQGQAAGVATFVKQLGGNAHRRGGEDASETRLSLNDKKGADPAEWPTDLRVQEWPHPCSSVSIRG